MNMISVTGGNKFQREIAYKTVGFMIDELLPRFKTLDIEVTLKNMDGDDAVGYCNMGDNNREFEIECSKNLTLKDFVTTLCHEMVHVKQYARNEMSDAGYRWKKKHINDKTPYFDLPWEKEAYKMQDKLAKKVWDADIL
jgi:hypothetical protein